jgi:phosphate transport system substrate-binding protein
MLLPKNALCVGIILSLLFSLAWAGERIVIQGSTTVLPLVQILAEKYMEKHPEVDISVSGGGSGVGITALLDGITDIAMSSREAKEKEVAEARARGKDLIPVVIAYDAIAVIVHPKNPIDTLSLENLRRIYTGDIRNWKDLGGPPVPVVPISREFASGTFEVFNRVVLQKEELTPSALMLVSNLTILQEVSSSPGCIGYVGLGYVRETVKVVALEGVFPTKESVRLGQYPLARPLYLYLARPPEGSVGDFIAFALSEEGQYIVAEEGFIPVRAEENGDFLVVEGGDAHEKSGNP